MTEKKIKVYCPACRQHVDAIEWEEGTKFVYHYTADDGQACRKSGKSVN